jgi:hypothetical protein
MDQYWEKGGFKDKGITSSLLTFAIAHKNLDNELDEYHKQAQQ